VCITVLRRFAPKNSPPQLPSSDESAHSKTALERIRHVSTICQVSPASACMSQGACAHLRSEFYLHSLDVSHALILTISLHAAGHACTEIAELPAAPLQIETATVCCNALFYPVTARTRIFPARSPFRPFAARRYLFDSLQLRSSPMEHFSAFCKRREA